MTKEEALVQFDLALLRLTMGAQMLGGASDGKSIAKHRAEVAAAQTQAQAMFEDALDGKINLEDTEDHHGEGQTPEGAREVQVQEGRRPRGHNQEGTAPEEEVTGGWLRTFAPEPRNAIRAALRELDIDPYQRNDDLFTAVIARFGRGAELILEDAWRSGQLWPCARMRVVRGGTVLFSRELVVGQP